MSGNAEEAARRRQRVRTRRARALPARGAGRRPGCGPGSPSPPARTAAGSVDRARGDDHGQERDHVHDEAGERAAARQQQARDHGPDRAREVELQRVQRDRVRDLRRRHHAREHRLVGGRRLRLGEAGQERQRPGWARCPGGQCVEHAQRRRERHLQDLRREQDGAAVDAVRHGAAHQHERDERRLGRERAQAQVEGIAHPRVDEPGQRHVLGPGAQAAQERADPEQAVVAVPESLEERRRVHTIGMPFSCPGCAAAVPGVPRFASRCPPAAPCCAAAPATRRRRRAFEVEVRAAGDAPRGRGALEPGRPAAPARVARLVHRDHARAGRRAVRPRALVGLTSGRRAVSAWRPASWQPRWPPSCAPSAPSPCACGAGGSPSASRSSLVPFLGVPAPRPTGSRDRRRACG